jgi:carbon storage regulator CsrA
MDLIGFDTSRGFWYKLNNAQNRIYSVGYDSLFRTTACGGGFFFGHESIADRTFSKANLLAPSGERERQKGPIQRQGGVSMLVLTRRPGEQIVIDGNIRLTVISVKGDRIRLGIDAPPSVVVDREEIHERRQHSPEEAPHPCHTLTADRFHPRIGVSSR